MLLIPYWTAIAGLLFFSQIVTACEVQHKRHNGGGPNEATLHRLQSCLQTAGIPASLLVARENIELRQSQRVSTGHNYTELNFQYNSVCGQLAPWAYFVPRTEQHVAAAVRCATQVNIRIVPRSGGHSYLMYGFGDRDSLVVDLGNLDRVRVDEKAMVAVMGPGARAGEVEYELWAQTEGRNNGSGGLIVPIGICPSVGVAGFSMGGGFGYYTRLMGLGSDNIVEARMVTANGSILTASANQNQELLWAIRGAGGGSLGIITSLKLKVHRAPSWIAFAEVHWHPSAFPEFFMAWQAFISGRPARHLTALPEMSGTRLSLELSSMRYDDDGGTAAIGEVQQILARHFPPPQNLTLRRLKNVEFMMDRAQFYSPVPITNPSQLSNFSWYSVGYKRVKSMYATRVLDVTQVRQLNDLLRDGLWAGGAYLFIEHYGGAINDLRPTDTCFFHRGDHILYNVQLIAESKKGQVKPGAVRAMRQFFEDTKTLLGHTESYQNYIDDDLLPSEYLRRYYGINLERLVAVKRSVDPENVFRNPLSIPVSLQKFRKSKLIQK